VVDAREAEILEREPGQAGHGVIGGQLAPGHGAEKLSKPTFIQSFRIVQSLLLPSPLASQEVTRVSPLPAERLTLLVYVALGASFVLLAAVALLAYRLRAVRRTYARLLAGGGSGEDILAAVARQVEAVDRLRGKLNLVGREAAQLRQRVSTTVRTVGFTRYDAFQDVGGHLSYSAAFLDEAGDGVVLSAINGRSETRSYAKPVRGGHSDHNLSDEERTAIALAMGQSAPIQREPV